MSQRLEKHLRRGKHFWQGRSIYATFVDAIRVLSRYAMEGKPMAKPHVKDHIREAVMALSRERGDGLPLAWLKRTLRGRI